ncbi:hypothetical protein V6N11_062054 [Hibiscus sabdariffa]|uniref:Uncharacterized protein n=1 Tax=Hibiscus sabdariffa TaxID=183260 RepID=A0ABR2PRE3_9ROSI
MLREAERRPAEPGQDLLYHIEQKTQEIQRLKDHIKYLENHGLPPSAYQGETLFSSLSRAAPTSVFSPFDRREPPHPPNVFNYHTTEPRSYKEATIPKIATVKRDDNVQSSSESESSDDSQSASDQTSSDDEVFMAVPEVKTEEYDSMDTDASPSTSAPPPFQINSGKHIFTIDDIPSTR